MSSDYIGGDPPRSGKIFVSRGCDRAFTVASVDNTEQPVDYPDGAAVYMLIDIDKTDPTRVDAAVSGSNASFHIQSAVLDLVTNRTSWRAVLELGDNEIPLLTGKFERHDG